MSLLIELGTEDLPARYVQALAEALGNGIAGGLDKAGIPVDGHRTFATPRRIAVLIQKVARQQPERKMERLGPALAVALKDGKPTPAALGFAKSCGVDFSELGEKDGKLYFSKTAPGQATAQLLPAIFEDALKQMDELVPKRMRWGEGTETFVRPVKWILALLDGAVVPLHRFGLDSGAVTYGHRFHAPAAIALKSADEYEAALRTAKVWADFAGRKATIKAQIEAAAVQLKGTARITDDLLNEVTALVEWPVAISGRMEERFMQLPPEVIVATVEINQRYFTVFDAQNKLLPVFIAISNIESKDVSQVIAGNERVVRPRLSDAAFFWESDRKQTLASRAPKLQSITFQAKLGSLQDKVQRVQALAGYIAPAAGAEAQQVERAVQLAKCDLLSAMVGEFPELQGIMGSYYARHDGEAEPVAQALREQYLPRFAADVLPASPCGITLAVADKLDTLCGIFTVGLKPTSSKDPFGLRRAALGVLRIAIEKRLDLDLQEAIARAVGTVRQQLLLSRVAHNETINTESLFVPSAARKQDPAATEIYGYCMDRLRAYYIDRQLPVEMFEAVHGLGVSRPLDFDDRVQALRDFWALPAAKNLAAAHKRVRNILKQAGDAGILAVDTARLEHAAEKNLFSRLTELRQSNAQADYRTKLINLAQLREAVDAFFEDVMVNAEDPAVRANRLALLRELDATCREVADISCLPG